NSMCSMHSDSGPTNQENCAVWHDCVTHKLPNFYPSSPASHPVDTGDNFDEHAIYSLPPCLFTFKNDLGFALIKAQRLQWCAERCLVWRCLKWIKIEKQFYNSIDHEAGWRLHAADVNIGIACGI
ncbi:hypothetical protein V8B97DRAFT_1870604, partial [Scleroderma yunnanense]